MRIALKHQIILAPAVVLLILSLLLGFLQYSYWSLSNKRAQARELRTIFIALAEADIAARRIDEIARKFGAEHSMISMDALENMSYLHGHYLEAIHLLEDYDAITPDERHQLLANSEALKPQPGYDLDRALEFIRTARPILAHLTDYYRERQQKLGDIHAQDIDSLVARTTLVSTIVLGSAILLGVALSLTLARRLRSRIQELSASARRIADGDHNPPPAPDFSQDELDALAISIRRMAEGLIRTVGSEKLLEGAEEERRRIAMDLHDQTLSDLSSVLRGLQEIQRFRSCRKEAGCLEEDLQKAIANLRDVMNNLHPQTLDILGLEAALESQLERIFKEGSGIEYHLQTSPRFQALSLNRLQKITLFRILTEACQNVLKHSAATRVEISLDVRDNQLAASVEDNGKGMNAATVPRGRGLNNMEERGRAIGARTQWGPSRFSSGVRFELNLPLKSDSED